MALLSDALDSSRTAPPQRGGEDASKKGKVMMPIEVLITVPRGCWGQISREISVALETDEMKQARYVDDMFSQVSANIRALDDKNS
jgi:hypothetical protein